MRAALRLLLATVVAAGSAGAAGRAAPQSPEASDRPFLLTLRGEIATVNYTPGSLDRAVHVQRRLELLARDVGRWTGTPVRLRVFVLSREEWGKFGFLLPYGLPGRIGVDTLAVPAAGDSETVRLWTDICGAPLEPLPGRPLKGTAVEAASLALSDLLMEVEAARLLLALTGFEAEWPWLHQVTAHLLARAAFERYEEGRLPQIDELFARLGHGVAEPLPIERYAPGLDLETFLWFESRFYDGARHVMASGGKNEARSLLKRVRKASGTLSETTFYELFPDLRDWRATAFAPAAG